MLKLKMIVAASLKGNGRVVASPTSSLSQGMHKTDSFQRFSEVDDDDEGLGRAFALFAVALPNFEKKLKSSAKKKSSEIIASVSEEIHLELQNVIKSYIINEAEKTSNVAKTKRKHAETRLQGDKKLVVFRELKQQENPFIFISLHQSSLLHPTMTTVAATSLNVATPRAFIQPVARLSAPVRLNYPWKYSSMKRMVMSVKATSEGEISEKVEKSIQEAKETCADDPVSGECVAAWDEVEELSAAASHARDKKKAGGSDPLEEYCSDNPETDECRTYDN